MSRARWVLKCKECRANCTFSEIDLDETSEYFFPKRPPMPTTGIEHKCSHCGHVALYQRTDLTYEDDVSPSSEPKCR